VGAYRFAHVCLYIRLYIEHTKILSAQLRLIYKGIMMNFSQMVDHNV